MQMLANLGEGVFVSHFFGDHVIEKSQQFLQLDIDLVVEIGLTKCIVRGLVLQRFHFLADVVDLLDHLLYIDFVVFGFVLCLSSIVLVHFLKLLSAHLPILLRFAGLILT
jgi:hypothetical protein